MTENSQKPQQLSSPSQLPSASSYGLLVERALGLQGKLTELRLALIAIGHELELASSGLRSFEQAHINIKKIIGEELNGSLVHTGREGVPHAED